MNRLGPYQVRGELARGAMGIVFRAHDPALDRDLALKIVRLEELRDEEAQQRFLREVRIMARLRHRHVIAVHAAGVSSHGYPYVAMDLIEGGSLNDRLKSEGRLPIREAVRYAIQLASALDYAHARGVLHRDIKPHNVLLDGEDALLTDFGLAKSVGADAQGLTQSGDRIGTPVFMAPEQALGDNHRVGPETDVYALGATLFNLLTGVRPFRGSSLHELFENIVSEPPASLQGARPEIDAGLAAVVERCLAKQPEDRYRSAGSLRDALEAWLDGASSGKDAPAEAELPALPSRRQRVRRSLVAAGCLALGLGVGLALANPLQRGVRRDVWIEELPEELRVVSSRGSERESREDFEGALSDYSAVIEGEPDCASAWFQRARTKRGLGDAAGAIADLDEAIRIDPEFARAFNLRGLLKFSDDPLASLADNDRSIELDPSKATFFTNRAALHYKQGRDAEALADADRALALDPRYAQAYYMRGLIKQRTEGDEAALAEWDLALRCEPHALDPLTARGELRTKLGDPRGGLEDLSVALTSLVEKATYHYLRSEAHQALGEWEAALADLNTAVEIDPKHSMSFARRAKLCLRFRRYEDAVRDYERAGSLLEEASESRGLLMDAARRVREGLQGRQYTVDAETLEMWEGPGPGYRVMADIVRGGSVEMLKREGEWAQVQVRDQTGQTHVGWVRTAFLSLVIKAS